MENRSNEESSFIKFLRIRNLKQKLKSNLKRKFK